MFTPATWPQRIKVSTNFRWRSIALRLRWPAAAVVFGASVLVLTSVAIRQGWLHVLVELAVAFAAIAGGAAGAFRALTRNYRQFVETMAQTLDARDTYTAGHSTRVADYAFGTARAMGISKSEARTIRDAAELHDIGKIGIPDAVLQKRGPLTLEEVGMIRLHTVIGRKILERAGHCKDLLPVVELHHENWDGTGYPYAMRGDEIPLEARIVRVADAFDAMTSRRCYREASSVGWAAEELRRCSGTQFDPRVVNVFLALLEHGVFQATLQYPEANAWRSGEWAPEEFNGLTLEIASVGRGSPRRA